MLISYNWLQQFIPDLGESPAAVAEALSLSLAEVEEVRKVGSDNVLEIENKALSHRPDLFSQLGMAREVAAALNKNMKHPMFHVAQPSPGEDTNYRIKISVEDETLCLRYMTVLIGNLKVGESPGWMQKRLHAMGQRPINNIVDITNYVMHEIGQPTHIFDVSKLETRNSKLEIGIRQARKGETLETIDKIERKFNGGELVITSTIQPSNHSTISDTPVALAGIMGGAKTQVSDTTTTILLESANFNMYSVRQTSKQLGLRTEASLRFEKGLDPNLAEKGMRRCVELFKEIAGGQVISEVTDFYPTPIESIKINVNLDKARQFLGLDLSNEEILGYWKRLHLNNTSHTSDTSFIVTVPTFRRDLTIPEDLYEEVARLHGYNNFVPTLPIKPIAPPLENKDWQFANKVRQILVGLGMDEVLTYSFVPSNSVISDTDPESTKHGSQGRPGMTDGYLPLKLTNPMAPEMAYLRTSLLPSLREKVAENAKRFDRFGVFEIGKVTRVGTENTGFRIQNLELENREELIANKKDPKHPKLPNEPKMLAIAYYDRNKDEKQVYLHTKGILETLLATLNILTLHETSDVSKLAPNTYGFEIELATLQELAQPVEFRPIPAHIPTYQDLSFIVDENIAIGEILKVIHDIPAAGEETSPLQNVELTDVYQSDQLRAQHQKSLTVRLEFLDPKGPLSDREVTPYRKKIEKKLKEEFGATIR